MQAKDVYNQPDLFVPGVYRLVNTTNNRSYVGESSWIVYRIYDHCFRLNRGKHRRAELQADWANIGSDMFKFEVLRVVEDYRARLCWEAHYIVYGGFELYNTARDISDRRYVTKSLAYALNVR